MATEPADIHGEILPQTPKPLKAVQVVYGEEVDSQTSLLAPVGILETAAAFIPGVAFTRPVAYRLSQSWIQAQFPGINKKSKAVVWLDENLTVR